MATCKLMRCVKTYTSDSARSQAVHAATAGRNESRAHHGQSPSFTAGENSKGGSNTCGKDRCFSNYPDAVAVSIDLLRPQRAIAAMVNSGKKTPTDMSSGTERITGHTVQANEVLLLYNCITCNVQAVIRPE